MMPSTSLPVFEELFPVLQQLDGLLERSVKVANQLQQHKANAALSGSQPAMVEVGTHLAIPPSYPRYRPAQSTESPSSKVPSDSRLGALRRLFSLTDFDIDILLIALAPELDRRYEGIYAYLQEDARCGRPSVGLALDLLCENAAQKLQLRSHFAPTAPLFQHHLVKLVDPPHQNHPSLLASELILDASLVRYLFQESGLNEDLQASCSLMLNHNATERAVKELPAAQLRQVQALITNISTTEPLRLYLQSNDLMAVRQFAEAFAHQVQRPLLRVDLEQLAHEPGQFPQRLGWLMRDACLQQVVLCLHSVEALKREATAHLYSLLIEQLAEANVPIILAGQQPWQPSERASLGMVSLQLIAPDTAERSVCWQAQLASYGFTVKPETVTALADRFKLTSTQIKTAIATARNALNYELESVSIEEALFTAARNQSGHQLAKLAQVVQPKYGWDDIVLPKQQKTQLQEICLHMQHRHRVFDTWGFDQKLSLGKGINALFAGPPGTGKTMAAEVIASSLQLDLYRIDLSQVVSKYIGETEKNLNQIFTAAANANAILLFDEADALFGKRTEVKDSHDRYANLEVGYLLQQMEAYEGLAILTTNLKANLDQAFIRRLRFILDFPLPALEERRHLWQQVWPGELPLEAEIDWDMLAQRFELAGGSIRNIALAAAFLAANDTGKVSFLHIKQAIRREYQKMGKLLMDNMFIND